MSRKIKWGVLGTADIARRCTIPGMKLHHKRRAAVRIT